MAINLVFCGAFLATEAQAGCPLGQDVFTSCEIEGRNTEVFVCFDDQRATYSYGPIGGAPELVLAESIDQVDFEPWSGSGTAISESVTFYNNDYAYDVGGGFDRPFSDEEMDLPIRRFGWIEVTESGEPAASLSCIPETVSYGFGGGIYDFKTDIGQTWDPYSFTWVSNFVQPTDTSVLREVRPFGVSEYCLPASEFHLGNVGMGDPVDTLSTIERSVIINDPDYVGEDLDRMVLVDGYIDIFQDQVVAISTTSPDWLMPSGLRVGLTRGEVIRILGRVPGGYAATSQRFSVPVCMDIPVHDPEWTMLIDIGHDKRVKRIHFIGLSH